MSINQVERAFRAWPVLIQAAKNRQTITYGQLGNALDIHHRAVRFVLGVIQDYCMEADLPPLTILVVNASKLPGSGFIAWDLRNFEDGLEEVFGHDWAGHENPFGFAAEGHTYKSIIASLVNEPASSEEMYTLVKSRGMAQMLFREALLEAYSSKCAFTGMDFYSALEAAHIIPWKHATDSQRLDVRNGILLNSFHHKLFDAGDITISPDFKIEYYDPKEQDSPYSDLESALSSKLHGKQILLPSDQNLAPSREYLALHYKLHDWEF